MSKINEIFREYGYNSQVAVAKALQKLPEYSRMKPDSVRAYLNQVINGNRPFSKKLKISICQIVNGDIRMAQEIEVIYSPKNPLNQTLRAYYTKLEIKFVHANSSTQLQILTTLDNLCEQIEQKETRQT